MVQVVARQAQAQLNALSGSVRGVGSSANVSRSAVGSFAQSLRPNLIQKFGNQLQWTGRQLQYNFTLPLLLAGGAAAKFELDNQKAMTGVTKVYGDGSAAFNQLSKTEIPALGRAFEALSNEFAVNRKEVIGIAADWAQAGASGVALAKSTKLTLETMILGEMSATEATQALIAIQAQYGQTIDQLAGTIDVLNMVENQTGITMQGLVQGFGRAAGVARSAGIDVRHLAAFLAALTPAAGSAAQAGNALKTIFSRLMAPTKQATEVMHLMGIETNSASWQAANGVQRIEMMAQSYKNLSGAQKLVVSSTIASRFQINRWDVLMRDVINKNGYYQRALNSTADATANYRQRQKELNVVLTSAPQRLHQAWVVLQNAMADIIQPLIPAMVYLTQEVAKAARWFDNLSPSVQKLVLTLAVLLAAVGPVVRYFGALNALFGTFIFLGGAAGKFVAAIAKDLLFLVRIPIGILTTGIGALLGGVGRLAIVFLAMSRAGVMALFGLARGFVIFPATLRAFAAFWMGTFAAIRGFTVVWATQMKILFSLVSLGVYAPFEAISKGVAVTITYLGRLLFSFRALPALLVGGFSRIVPLLMGALRVIPLVISGPFALAIGAVLLIFAAFHRQIATLWSRIQTTFQQHASGIVRAFQPIANFFASLVSFISKMFWKLPESITSAMIAVVKVIQHAAMGIYELFQYMNPFAHHSPSLVENTEKGMGKVGDHHKQAARTASNVYTQTASDIQTFSSQTARFNTPKAQFADSRKTVAKVDPAALASFDKLIKDLTILTPLMNKQKAAVDAQQIVVDGWKKQLDAANASLDTESKKLQDLQATADKLSTSLDQHKQSLQDYANAPIKGERAMSDAIFQTEMASKAAQLQLMKMEDVVGPLDQIQSKMADLNGQIESMRGQEETLRQAGAGSDILKTYDDQVNGLIAQKKQMQDSVAPMVALQKQIDQLDRHGQELDLENSLQFDPLHRQIDQLANSIQEVSFDNIIAGVTREQAAIANLQPQLDAANKAVADQQTVVDNATVARDALQVSYDKENATLQTLQDSYNKTHDTVSAVTDALNGMSAAMDKTASSKTPKLDSTASNFAAGAAGNFPDVGGSAQIGREGGLGDQSKLIDQFVHEQQQKLGSMFGGFDLFKPIRKKFDEFKTWLSATFGPAISAIGSLFTDLGKDFSQFGSDVSGPMKSVQDVVSSVFDVIARQVRLLAKLFGPDLKRIWNSLVAGFQDAWKQIEPQVAAFSEVLAPLGRLLKSIWVVAKPIIAELAAFFILRIKMMTDILSRVLGPAIHMAVGMISGSLQIIRGVILTIIALINFVIDTIKFFYEILTGQWGKAFDTLKTIVTKDLNDLGKGVWDIIDGLWRRIESVFTGEIKIVIAIVQGFIDSIIGIFKFLWDELVGHSIIPDMLNAIVNAFTGLPGRVLTALATLGSQLLTLATSAMASFGNGFAQKSLDLMAWFGGLPGQALAKLGSLGSSLLSLGSSALGSMLSGLKSAWSGIHDWFAGLPGDIVGFFDGLGGKIAKKVAGAFNGLVTAMRDALNWVIDLWNSMHFSIGGWGIDKGPIHIHVPTITVGLPHIPHVGGSAVGASSAGSISVSGGDTGSTKGQGGAPGGNQYALAVGGLVKGATTLVGEGSNVWPEFVIPTDPRYRSRALGLAGQLARQIAPSGSAFDAFGAEALKRIPAMASGGIVGVASARATRGSAPLQATMNENTTVNINGNLEFPNIRSGNDAQTLIDNLKAVAAT